VYGLGRALSQVTALVLLPIYLSHLTPADYGVLAVSQMVGPVLGALWTFGIESAVGRFYYEYQGKERERVVGTAFTLARITTVLGLLLTLAIGPGILPHLVQNAPYSPHILLVIWTTFFNTFSVLPLILMRVQEEAHKYIFATFGTFLMTIIANVYFVVYAGWGVVGVLTGNLVSSMICAAGYLWYLRRYMVLTFDWNYARCLLRYVLPFMPELTLGSLVAAADRFFLDKWVPVAEIGLYSLARQFASVAMQVIQSLKTAYTPIGFKIWTQNAGTRRRDLACMSLWYVGISGLATATVVILSHDVVLLLGRQGYLGAIPLVPLLTASYLALVVYWVISMTFLVGDDTKFLFISFMVYGVLFVGLNMVFVPQFGVWAAVVAALVAQMGRAVVTYFMGERRKPIGLPVRGMLILLSPAALLIPFGMWGWGNIAWQARLASKMGILGSYGLFVLVYMARFSGIPIRHMAKRFWNGLERRLAIKTSL